MGHLTLLSSFQHRHLIGNGTQQGAEVRRASTQIGISNKKEEFKDLLMIKKIWRSTVE